MKFYWEEELQEGPCTTHTSLHLYALKKESGRSVHQSVAESLNSFLVKLIYRRLTDSELSLWGFSMMIVIRSTYVAEVHCMD